MKSSAPWSVKGIERDARETAKEAAKREGMTVGEWLNQMIYSAGDAQSSGGEVEGLKLRDIVTAIEHLHKRVADSQTESAGAVAEMTRKIGDVVERIQRLERVKPAEGSDHDLAERIERLEQRGEERERIDALKALEKAVAQVAVQFNNAQKTSTQRLDAAERQLQQFASRIDTIGAGESDEAGVGSLKEAIDNLSERLARAERIAEEAAKLKSDAGGSTDPDFVESTSNRLRVLGDEIKRGGDQIRALEATIGKLSSQIEAAERRSAEGVQKVAETIADMREKFADDAVGEAVGETSRADIDAAVAEATKETEDRISGLQRSFDDMIARLEALSTDAGTPESATDEADEEIGVAGEAAALSADLDDPPAANDLEAGADIEAPNTAPETTGDAPTEDHGARSEDETAAFDDDEETAEDEDPFAFADEIEAALEEAADDSEDDFTFELDDDADKEDETPAVESSNSDAQQLLSEVKAVFGRQAKESEAADQDQEEDEAATGEDDLDAILADLDDLTAEPETSPDAPKTDDVEEEDAGPDIMTGEAATETEGAGEDEDADEFSDEEASKENYLKAARRRAIESAQHAGEGKKPLRRTLTPKQKAILAARVRKKRLAEQTGGQPSPDPEKMHAAREALRGESAAPAKEEEPAQEESEKNDEETHGRFAGVMAALRGKLPFVGTKTGSEEPAKQSADVDTARHGDRAAFQTLKATVSARPVTLALTVGIFLSIGALFYLVKDIIFPAPEPRGAQPAPTIVSDAPSADQPADAATEEDAAAASDTAPAIDPRTLYMDAMAALGAAGGAAEADEAISKLHEAAALGHPPAQLQLGELYKTGQGVDQDLGQARTWFRRAANGGNILAMHRIGVMTARGDGGPADTGEAISWFERAANRGLVDSQYNLGAIYHPTEGGASSTVQDAGKAYYWYSLAAENGDEQAAPLAESIGAALTAQEKSELDQAITEWEALPADEAANELAPSEG